MKPSTKAIVLRQLHVQQTIRALIYMLIDRHYQSYHLKAPRTGLLHTGEKFIQDLLLCGHAQRIEDVLRIPLHVFDQLEA